MRQWAAVLFLLASASQAHDLKKFEFDTSAAANGSATCAFENLRLPDDLLVYAAGGYSGRELEFQIDQSGHEATQFDVAVNSPSQPVALMLGAYEPTIWNIGWTEGTRIVAVLVSGYHRQAVAGLENSVPVLNSSHDNKGACGYFYVSNEQNTTVNPIARKLFQKPVDLMFAGNKTGKILVGEQLTANAELVTSGARPPESFRDKNAPLAGEAGLESAVANGVLRPATSADAEAWVAAVMANRPAADAPPVAGQGVPRPAMPGLYNAYVVTKKFTYPSGLYGAHAATFFILRGVPRPSGNPGHSAVYDFNFLSCQGALCSAR
jgi:hypothetical protein